MKKDLGSEKTRSRDGREALMPMPMPMPVADANAAEGELVCRLAQTLLLVLTLIPFSEPLTCTSSYQTGTTGGRGLF